MNTNLMNMNNMNNMNYNMNNNMNFGLMNNMNNMSNFMNNNPMNNMSTNINGINNNMNMSSLNNNNFIFNKSSINNNNLINDNNSINNNNFNNNNHNSINNINFNNNNHNSINNNNFNNNNHNNKGDPPKSIRKKPLDFYKSPTFIGLQNIGATCFMNATLQCLSQTEDLTNYFLDEKRSGNKIKNNNIAIKNRNSPQLSPVYLELVKKLWDKNNIKGYFAPNKFMKLVETMNPLFKLGQPGDSKDFIIFLLEQFHTELKKVVSNNNNNEQPNQYDQQNAFMYFFQDFSKQTSIISDIFFGIQESSNICLFCKKNYSSKGKPYPICYNYQIFNCLIFPLEEIRKYKNENNMGNYMNMNQSNAVTLDDCFYFNQKTDLFTGDNRNYCNICLMF